MLDQDPGITEAKQRIVNDLLIDLPPEVDVEVDLPSECRVYKLEDPAKPITLRPMTFEDEKNMLNSKKGHDPINIILQKCTTNLNVADLLSIDKLYLIMKLREISYGDDYNTLLICRDCGAENPTVVKLSELNINPVPDDFTDPVEIELPSIQKNAKVLLPRVRDENLFANDNKAFSQLWRFIAEIDGHSDKTIISGVLEKLPIKDMRLILNAMKTDFGVETKVKFECTSCKEVSIVDLPIDANFFDVS